MVQWLRVCVSTAWGRNLIPGWGTKIPHAFRCGQKKKKKKDVPLTTPSSGSPQTISVRLGQSKLYLIISDLLCDFNCIHLITGSHILRVGLRLSFSANFEIWAIMRFLGGHTLWPSCQLSRLHKIVCCFIVQLPTFCLMKNSLCSLVQPLAFYLELSLP